MGIFHMLRAVALVLLALSGILFVLDEPKAAGQEPAPAQRSPLLLMVHRQCDLLNAT
jgi:hypothetical protein